MGALPSRETHARGLYTHRHGRNRRNEIILIPLTKDFFPVPDCPLFERLYQSRSHRTAKYYYRQSVPDTQPRSEDHIHPPRFSDTPEGLYRVLIEDNHLCVVDTDEQLRQVYLAQQQQQQQPNGPGSAAGAPHVEIPMPTDEIAAAIAREFLSGSAEDTCSAEPPRIRVPVNVANYLSGISRHTYRNAGGTHVTSPSANYIRPIPCAIAGRFDPSRHAPAQGVDFAGTKVVILGMFGLFPCTLQQSEAGAEPQHLLKGTMFVDKDVGDQILGNVVLLAAHMYVRQCLEVRIRPHSIPSLPVVLRVPMSNIPMLQFVREMRFRLRVLLDAGQQGRVNSSDPRRTDGCSATDGVGLSIGRASCTSGGMFGDEGHAPLSYGKPYFDLSASQATDFLYEEDDPSGGADAQLLSSASGAGVLGRQTGTNTNPGPTGTIPFLMMSGYNVLNVPFAHPLLSMAQLRAPRPKENLSQRTARLRSRFRMWAEDGHLVIWSSAAFARRGCLLLSQQLNTTVDSNDLPVQRPWNYRGVLRPGATVPKPEKQNDVFIVGVDAPTLALWRGDVLRACTPGEVVARDGSAGRQEDGPACSDQGLSAGPATSNSSTDGKQLSEQLATGTNFTSNHSSNPLLQDPGMAPVGAFWVRGPARPADADRTRMDDTVQYGSLNIEEVLLSWIRTVSIQTRDVHESEDAWLRDEDGQMVRVDRYVIRRLEHDGIRHFIGVTPKFIGQQRRLEKVLADQTVVERLGEEESALAQEQNHAMHVDLSDFAFGSTGPEECASPP